MNNYYDKYGRLHDKPCINEEPKSNNGWLYTAYAKKLGIPLDIQKLSDCMEACYEQSPVPHFNRSPGKQLPPMSRDEILGLVYLDIIQHDGDKTPWNFSPYPIPRFNSFKLAAQLWQLRPSLKRHRNYFWENNLDQIYRFAFSVPLVDRAFILQCWGETHTPRALFYRAIAFVDSLIGKDSGIRWLKYGKSLEAMQEEFPEDHPLKNSLTNK